jgi:hypothetical protein
MRDGDAVADARRSQALALEERIEYFASGQPRRQSGALAHLLQRLFLAVDAKRRDDPIGRKKIG